MYIHSRSAILHCQAWTGSEQSSLQTSACNDIIQFLASMSPLHLGFSPQTSFFTSVDMLLAKSQTITHNTAMTARLLPAGPRKGSADPCYAICFMPRLSAFEVSQELGRPLTDLTEKQIQTEYTQGHKNKAEGRKRYDKDLDLVRRRYHSLAQFLSSVAERLGKPGLRLPPRLRPLTINPTTASAPAPVPTPSPAPAPAPASAPAPPRRNAGSRAVSARRRPKNSR